MKDKLNLKRTKIGLFLKLFGFYCLFQRMRWLKVKQKKQIQTVNDQAKTVESDDVTNKNN